MDLRFQNEEKMTEDLSLNNPNSLNPPINANSILEIEPKKVYPKLPSSNSEVIGVTNKSEQKEKMIENWNNSPKVKETGVKAIDLNRFKEIGKKMYGVLIFLAVIGSIVIILAIGVTGWTIYHDGTLRSPVSLICAPSLNVSVPSCPPAPDCNCPSLSCGNVTILPTEVNVYLNSSA
jgi:hypothetical protein